MTRRGSRRLATAGAAVAVLALVAGGIAANVALLDAQGSDGLGRLSPIATDADGGAASTVDAVPAGPATVRAPAAPPRGDDHRDDDHRDDGHHGEDD